MKKIISLICAIILTLSISAQTGFKDAVDFNCTDEYGTNVHLFDILDDGQYALLYFFWNDGNNSEIIEMGLLALFSVKCDYQQYNTLLPFIENFGGGVTDTQFAADITVKFSLASDRSEALMAALTDRYLGRLHAVAEGKVFAKIKNN